MKNILINSDGYVASPYIKNATITLEITDAQYEKIQNLPFNHAWKYENNDFILEPLMDLNNLKELRQKKCFNIIDNRSIMWYNHLSNEQKQELEIWYKAWLDITKTKVIPEKPEWL